MSTHTIGEVLNRLKDEFSDITISKIRFLEAEGLISPDRTESGYRKFTEEDVDRLRYVLRAQRDRYLPLKVIKEELRRLDTGLDAGPDAGGAAAGALPGTAAAATADPASGALDDGAVAGGAAPGTPGVARERLTDPPADVDLSAHELADSAGLEHDDLAALREHGLLGPGPSYDADDLRVARLAADLLGRGLEVRHLRMYRQFADREAALVEQLVTPLLRQRNPDSRRAATEQAEGLASSGGALYQAMLAKQLRASLGR